MQKDEIGSGRVKCILSVLVDSVLELNTLEVNHRVISISAEAGVGKNYTNRSLLKFRSILGINFFNILSAEGRRKHGLFWCWKFILNQRSKDTIPFTFQY